MRPTALAIGLAVTVEVSLAAAQTTSPAYRITNARVTVLCPLTVGGSFEARTSAAVGNLSGDISRSAAVSTLAAVDGASLALTGAIQVDLATLETGIELRDRHMKDVYLEISRGAGFATARLEAISIDGAEGRTPFHGTLSLHGEQRPVSGVADLQGQRDGGVRVRARFPISLAAFGIQPPRYLGAGVQDQVEVQVTFTAMPLRSI